MIAVDEDMVHHRGVVCVSLSMDRSAAVAFLVLICVVSCSLFVVAVVALVDLRNFVVVDELNADVFASNLRFHPRKFIFKLKL